MRTKALASVLFSAVSATGFAASAFLRPVPVAAEGQTASATVPLVDLAFGRRAFSRQDRVALAPNGALVAYVVHEAPLATRPQVRYLANGTPANVIGHRIWLTSLRTSQTHAIATEAGDCWRPSWSPDSARLAMYCDGGGSPQVWIYDTQHDRVRKVSPVRTLPRLWTGDEPVWSPDGRELFVPLAPARAVEPPPQDPAVSPRDKSTVTVLKTVRGAQAMTTDNRQTNALLMSENNAMLAAIDVATGHVRTLVPANAATPPSTLRLSASGRWVAYLSVFHKPREIDTTMFHDLAVVPARGGAAHTLAKNLLVADSSYAMGAYVWHPSLDCLVWLSDGKLWTTNLDEATPVVRQIGSGSRAFANMPLSFLADGQTVVAALQPDAATRDRSSLALVRLDGSTPVTLTLPSGLAFQEVITRDLVTAWQPNPDGFAIVARETATMRNLVVGFAIASGQSAVVWKEPARLRIVGAAPGHDELFARFEDVETPENIYQFSIDFANKQRVTDIEPRLANVHAGSIETFETTVPLHDGTLAQTTTAILLPPGARRGDRLPAVVVQYPGTKLTSYAVEFGGGMPATMPVWPLAMHGYAVVLTELPITPIGSAGNPVSDVVDSLLPQIYHAADLGYVDPARLVVCGQSYGGYGALAIVSATNIFRGAVAISGLYDLPALYSWMTSVNVPLLARWAETGQGRLGTHPWNDVYRYLQNSPYYRADSIHSPVLMLHGEVDPGAPVEDARKMFNALKRLDRTAELRTYAGEGHVVYEWSRANAIDAMQRILGFLDEQLREASQVDTSAAATGR